MKSPATSTGFGTLSPSPARTGRRTSTAYQPHQPSWPGSAAASRCSRSAGVASRIRLLRRQDAGRSPVRHRGGLRGLRGEWPFRYDYAAQQRFAALLGPCTRLAPNQRHPWPHEFLRFRQFQCVRNKHHFLSAVSLARSIAHPVAGGPCSDVLDQRVAVNPPEIWQQPQANR
jgi:hypothetical protein